MLYFFNRWMRKRIQGLYVDTAGLDRVKARIKEGCKVVFLPLYRTFSDFYLMQFVHYKLGVPSGFTFGNIEDIPGTKITYEIHKRTGYISARNSKSQSTQSSFINSALLREVISRNQVTTIF